MDLATPVAQAAATVASQSPSMSDWLVAGAAVFQAVGTFILLVVTIIYVRATMVIAAANKATADAANAGLALASQAEARARKACLVVYVEEATFNGEKLVIRGVVRNEGLDTAYDVDVEMRPLSDESHLKFYYVYDDDETPFHYTNIQYLNKFIVPSGKTHNFTIKLEVESDDPSNLDRIEVLLAATFRDRIGPDFSIFQFEFSTWPAPSPCMIFEVAEKRQMAELCYLRRLGETVE